MFKRIDHVAVAVTNRERSIGFYETHFGFRAYFEHDVPGVLEIEKVVYLKLGDTILELEHWTEENKNHGYHFCLISDDFEADYKRLKEAGIPIIKEPHTPEPRATEETGWKRVVFEGPDGEHIEFRG